MRILLCALLALPLMATAQEPVPSLRTTSSEVLLDFVVRDTHGNVIRNLRPDEIKVFENGVLQPVRHFEFVDGHSANEPKPSAIGSIAPATTGAKPAQFDVNDLRDISIVTVVIANVDPRGRKLAEAAMKELIQKELHPNTFVGVFRLEPGGIHLVQNYTSDGAKIAAAVGQTVRHVNIDQPVTGELFRPQMGMGLGNDPNDPSSSMVSISPASTPVVSEQLGTSNNITASSDAMARAIALLMESEYTNEMSDAYGDSMRYLTQLSSLVHAQALIPGRKVVLLFSAGLPVAPDSVEMLRNVISSANRSNVSIYAVDTRGVTSQSDLDAPRRLVTEAAATSKKQFLAGNDQAVTPGEVMSGELADASIHADTRENLVELVSGTGGELLPDSLDLREPLRRVMEDVRTHYESSYSPTNLATDGTFRTIKVTVSRPGARVFARQGYYAVPMLDGHQVYPFEAATLKAINTRPLLHQFNFHAAALQFRHSEAQTQLSFVFQIPARDLTIVRNQQTFKVEVAVTALVKDDQGQVVAKISKDIPYEVLLANKAELERGTVSFTAPFFLAPGHYTIETATVDRESMKASVSRSTLDVDRYSGFSISDVMVVRSVDGIEGPEKAFDPLESRGGKVTPDVSDVVTPDASGNVKFYAVAYPLAPADGPVVMKVEVLQDEKVVAQSPVSALPLDANGAASMLASVPAVKLPAGHYEAEVSFQYKGERLTKRVEFTLAGGA